MTAPVALHEVHDESIYGGKARFLGELARAHVRIPDGVALPTAWVDRFVNGGESARRDLAPIVSALSFPVAVRSSAVGEDSRAASHAGQFMTKLHVRSHDELEAAITEVWRSASAATDYRARAGITTPAAMGIVVQQMLAPRAAGVAFTLDPVSGTPDIMIEASWGLGEAVVAGLVIPDSFRVSRDGKVLETRIGEKDIIVVPSPEGGTVERALSSERSTTSCLSEGEVLEIASLALRCEAVLGGNADIEWAVTEHGLFALQCRPITALR